MFTFSPGYDFQQLRRCLVEDENREGTSVIILAPWCYKDQPMRAESRIQTGGRKSPSEMLIYSIYKVQRWILRRNPTRSSSVEGTWRPWKVQTGTASSKVLRTQLPTIRKKPCDTDQLVLAAKKRLPIKRISCRWCSSQQTGPRHPLVEPNGKNKTSKNRSWHMMLK